MLTVILTILIFNSFLLFIAWLYSRLIIGICKCNRHLVGKVIIITGANAGIGFETAKDLASRGAKVILACRNEKRATKARNTIVQQTGNQDVHFKQLNLESFKSVREFAEDILENEKRLDILINNAGCYEETNDKTADGLLKTMQVNHFGPFLLTNLLLPLLKKSAPSRIVTVSSAAHKFAKLDVKDLNIANEFTPMKAYSNSKLCNILMTKELSKQLVGIGVTANCLHPGVIATDLLNNAGEKYILSYAMFLFKLYFKSFWEGAQTTIYLAVSPEVDDVSGEYFADCRVASLSSTAEDENIANMVWKESEKLVGLTK